MAYKKSDVIIPIILLILGLTMTILTAFDIFAPDNYRWIWTILGTLFMADSVIRFFRIKRHKQDEKYTS